MTVADFNLVQIPGCEQKTLYDTTGLFSSQNPNGWDPGTYLSGNPATADVETAVLEVTLPDGQVLTFDVYSDGTTTVPFPTTGGYYKIIEGISALNGIITATLTLTGSSIDGDPDTDFELVTTKKFLNTCKAECCISKLGSQLIPVPGCVPCQGQLDAKNKAFKELSNLLLAAQSQFDCENYDAVAATMARIDMICTSYQCKC